MALPTDLYHKEVPVKLRLIDISLIHPVHSSSATKFASQVDNMLLEKISFYTSTEFSVVISTTMST